MRRGERRGRVPAAWRRVLYGAAVLLALAWLVGAGPLGAFVGRLGEVQSNDPSAFLPEGAESSEAAAVREDIAGEEPTPAFVVYASADGAPDAQRMAEDAERIEDAGLSDGRPAGPIPGSDDGSVAQLVVPLPADADAKEAVAELRALLADPAPPGGTEVLVTGPAGFAADLSEAFAGIDGTLLAVALAAVLIILVAVYRSPLLPLVVVLASVLALALAAAVVYAAADAGWILLNGQSQGILFILVVGACTDYALLLVARYREALAHTPRPLEAVAGAVRGTAAPIAASAGTVILGVLCLLAADLSSNSSLGPVAALGIGAALVSALTFLPAVLLLLGRAAFWPFAPSCREGAGQGAVGGESGGAEDRGDHPLWSRIAGTVARRPRAWWIGVLVPLVATAALAPSFSATGTSTADFFRTEVESVAGQEALERGFGDTAAATPALVVADAGRQDDVIAAAEGVPGIGAAQPAGSDASRVLIEAEVRAPAESDEAVQIVADLRTAVQEVAGAGALVGGTDAVALDTREAAQSDLFTVVPLVIAVVFLVLVVLLRSLAAPVLLTATTVLSYLSAMGVGAFVFNEVLELPGADPVVPLFAFVFLVALGVDYNIFLMTRVREEAAVRGHRAAVLRGLTATGGVITSAGVVLAATFAALAVIPLMFLLQLAFLVAFGVLLDALIVRSLLVPALALDIGPKTWWPGRPRKRRAGDAASAQAGPDGAASGPRAGRDVPATR